MPGKDLAVLLEHVDHDQRVLWGWNQGHGRAPLAVPHAAFVAAFKRWWKRAAPVPAENRLAASARFHRIAAQEQSPAWI